MISRFLFFSVLYAGSVLSTLAQSSLYGNILHAETGNRIAGLRVTLQNGMNSHQVLTDSSGAYTFFKVNRGIYQLELTFAGREYIISKIHLAEGEFRELSFDIHTDGLLPPRIEFVDPGPALIQNGFGEKDHRVKYNGPPADMSQSIQKGYVDFLGGKLRIKGSDRVKIYIDQSPVMGQPIIERGW